MLKVPGRDLLNPFRVLKEGKGGLVYFYHDSCPTMPCNPNHPTFTQRAGMYGASTSTGVYFALSEQSCFIAHIKAHVRNRNSSSIRHKVSRLEGLDLKAQVTDRMHAILSRMGHNVTNVGVTKPYTKRSLLMINPGMYAADGSEQVGAYVAQAVWDYLGLKKEHYPVDRTHSGFVIDWKTQRPHMLSSAAVKMAEHVGLDGYEEFEEEGEYVKDFTFEIEQKEDWVGDVE
ncbi:hypothetical protein Q7P37_000968 [Cladosporium fusiforme]